MAIGFDLVDSIIAYEEGELSEEDTTILFQHLVNSGQAWTLQGHYGRVAALFLEQGRIVTKQEYDLVARARQSHQDRTRLMREGIPGQRAYND